MPIPFLLAAAAAIGRASAPKPRKKAAVSGYTRTTQSGKKVKVKAYTKNA
jgi:hypothetical protein